MKTLKSGLRAAIRAGTLTVLLGAGGVAWSAYPDKAVRLVVPYPAGGSSDIVGRVVAKYLTPLLGQPVVVQNIGGAGGDIGARRVSAADPDGYTLLLGSNALLVNKAIQGGSEYDPLQDFTPIALVGTSANVILGKPTLGADTWQDLLKLARETTNGLNYGTAGHGSLQHLVGETVRVKAKINMRHIAYKGGGPLLNDLLGGHVDLGVTSLAPALPFIRNGQVKAYLVTSNHRAEFASSIPATAEFSDTAGFALDTWLGVFGPAKLPAHIAGKLNEIMSSVSDDPSVKNDLALQAISARKMGSKEFRDFIASENKNYRAMVKDAAMKPE